MRYFDALATIEKVSIDKNLLKESMICRNVITISSSSCRKVSRNILVGISLRFGLLFVPMNTTSFQLRTAPCRYGLIDKSVRIKISSFQFYKRLNKGHSLHKSYCPRSLVTTKGISRILLNGKNDRESETDNLNSKNDTNWTWVATLILPLWLVYISSQWSRYSISYLVDFSSDARVTSYSAMNVDVGFNQAQYGVLASVAFTGLFAVASFFAGVAADKFDRKLLTIIACTAWATATLGTSFAENYEVVILWRIAMGLACAFAAPTAYTLIQENVPSNRVALGTSLYGTGIALGSALSAFSIILDGAIGWRQTEVLVAALGFGAAVLSAFLLPSNPKAEAKKGVQAKEIDNRSENDDDTSLSSLSSTISDVQSAVKASRVQWLYTAVFLRFCAGLCIGVWGAPYYRMVFPDNQEQYSVALAAISAIGATASGVLGGLAADYLSEQKFLFSREEKNVTDDPVGRRLWVPVIGSLLAAPMWYFTIQSGIGSAPSFEASMIFLAAEYFVAECWFGPTISSLQASVASNIRGTAQGIFSLIGALANSAPSLLGYLYGQSVSENSNNSGSQELSTLLIGSVCFGYISSAFCFGMASLAGKEQVDGNN